MPSRNYSSGAGYHVDQWNNTSNRNSNQTASDETYSSSPGSPYTSEEAASSATASSPNPPPSCCTSPEQIFGLAASLAVFLRSHLTTLEVQTLINLLSLLVANLSTMVIQEQLCEGIIVTPPE